MAYQWKNRIRYSEVGEDKKLTLVGLVDYFQDCSTFQSEELGVGLEKMEEKKRAWIMAYWQIDVKRIPELGEEITVETWPSSFRGFYGERNYRMLDAKGEMLAGAGSVWVYFDVENNCISKIDEEISNAYSLEEPLPMGKMIRKIKLPQECVPEEVFAVRKTHLDTNHHVNNGQYILMAQEYLPKDFELHKIRVEYRKPAFLHDLILPMVCVKDGICTVGLCDQEQQVYAAIEFS